jgi:2-dehydro-3-deoxy-D-gluconate 5-dehydrogenase
MGAHQLFDLSGRVALVTGASGGIGRELAQGLGQAGASIALNSRTQAALQQCADTLGAAGINAAVFPGDVSRVANCQALVSTVVERMGQVDILVNVAGINRRRPAVEFTEEDWDAVLDVNLKGLFFMSQAVGRYWLESHRFAPELECGKGKIINIASIAGSRGSRHRALYTASKSGVLGVTRTLAVEWAAEGICVNAIAPGYVETELTRPLFDDPSFTDWLQSRVPMGRHGHPGDLVGTAIFLAAPASDYITGQTIGVDGGLLANL